MNFTSIMNWPPNVAAFNAVNAIASPGLTFLMAYWADSYILVIPAIFLYMFYKRDRNAFLLVFSFVGLFALGYLLKSLIKEPRPDCLSQFSWINHLGPCESGFSLPSNHATALTGLYLFVDNYKYLRVLYLVWLVGVLFGRVYLGVHFLTDVLAGMIISIVMAKLIYIYRNEINKLLIGIYNSVMTRIYSKLLWK